MELEKKRRDANRWLVVVIVATAAMFGLLGAGLAGFVDVTVGSYLGPVVGLFFWISLICAIASGTAYEEAQKKEESPSCYN